VSRLRQTVERCSVATQRACGPAGKVNGQGSVSAEAVSDFFRWARQRDKHDVVDVWRKAVEVFPRASAIERYPDSVGDPTSRRSLQALFMVSTQLERDGEKVDEVEAVPLFTGDDGLVQRDVVLVVSRIQRRVVGVYQAWYGR
jgi:hypothetical protein